MRKFVIVLFSATLSASVAAKEPEIGSSEWVSARAVDALIISRIASRVCRNMALDVNNAKMAAEYYGFKTLDDLPEDKTRFFMSRFASNPEDACDYAWSQYGLGRGAGINRGLKFLIPAVRNPFSR